MTRSQRPPEPPRRGGAGHGDERPQSWMGAPGYTPFHDDLPPHAPMPGAPPYPASVEQPPPPVGRPAAHTGFWTAFAAAAVWAAVNLVLVLIVDGAPDDAAALGATVGVLLVPALLAALISWLIARRRTWSFWTLVLVAAPLFWVLRALASLPLS